MHRSAGAVPSIADVVPVDEAKVEQSAVRGSPAHRAVMNAFESAIADALHAATCVERAPMESLHAFRRSTRRARAIAAAVAEKLPTPVRLEINAALRAAIRETCTMRDHDVLPGALAALPVREGTEEARARLETELFVERARQRRPLSRVRQLAVAAARLSLLPDRLAAALAVDVTPDAIGAGLARLAQRARRAVRAALEHDEDVERAHTARKRVRLLAAAMNALHGPRSRAARRARELSRLSTKLGDTLDLELLASFARARSIDEGDEAYEKLLSQLAHRPRRRRPVLLERAASILRRKRFEPARLVPRTIR